MSQQNPFPAPQELEMFSVVLEKLEELKQSMAQLIERVEALERINFDRAVNQSLEND